MVQDPIEVELRSILAILLGLAPDDLPLQPARADLEGWDSLRHMQLVLAIEEEFGIRFKDSELADLDSLRRLVEAVKRKRQ